MASRAFRSTASLLGLALMLLGISNYALAAGESSEYAVEAAYLSKLVPFVEWPSASFETASSPLVLCVVGDDPFGSTLDRMAKQESGTRPIQVRRLRVAKQESGCHIMYLAGSGMQSVAQGLNEVYGEPILTATDFESERSANGIINFVIENRRVRFDIDDDSAADNGITISSKLLSLARAVKRRE